MDQGYRSKKRMTAVASVLFGALAVGTLPLANAALDSGNFSVRAENADDPTIFSIVGMRGSITDPGGGGETPEEPETPEPPKERFAFTISTTAPGCANPVVSLAGLSNSPTLTSPSGTKTSVSEGTNATPASGRWVVEGNFNRFAVGSGSAANCLVSVDEWGETGTTDLSNAFGGTTNLTSVVAPPATVRNMSGIFQQSSFNGSIGNWDVSNVTNMGSAFASNTAFNQDISSWNVAKVTDFSAMFSGTGAFNQPIGSWNTGSALTMENMFWNAKAFDLAINDWDVSKVTNMNQMFSASVFNRALDKWRVNSVQSMRGMFSNNTVFNRDISMWQPFQVRDMTEMFAWASSFRQNLSPWYVGNVQDHLHFSTGTQIIREPNWSHS